MVNGLIVLAVAGAAIGLVLLVVLLVKAKEKGTITKSTEEEDLVQRIKLQVDTVEAGDLAGKLKAAIEDSDPEPKTVTLVLADQVVQFEIRKP